ncbi:iron ABC transporter permease [Oceanihabitans sp. IOP_32]|uniref:FecCD family ABC transporter permease n=1 Tax=Oceanihabitans sp. IOP_32 TaxID=2529032 RepID=UPI0012931EDF|nr:iron ABC transporter permease [Oceanihabitans sp. IOP_32]QFZ55280.1 iron ABC transporter permease [Oceanihabitans sp. IOP_32]
MEQQFIKDYKKYNKKRIFIILGLVVITFLVVQIAMLLGSFEITWENLKEFWTSDEDSVTSQVITRIRLPRIIAAIITGTALAVSGAVSQSLLRNPLASPFTLGISSSAAFGAAFAIMFLGAGSTFSSAADAVIIDNQYIVAASAFIWSLVSIAVIVLLSRIRQANPEVIILSGVILSSLFSAGISALQFFANDVQLASIMFWSFGDLGRASWDDITLILVFLIPALLYFLKNSWSYNSLKTGDDYAKSLGVNPERIRLTGMVIASLITAFTVAFYGIIGFIGLVVPHIMRRIIGNHEAYLIPASAIFGSLLLLLADTFARTIISPVILPVGIITSFIGAPLFIFLLIRGYGK